MEDPAEKPGFFSRMVGLVARRDEEVAQETDPTPGMTSLRLQTAHRYYITVRRQIVSFQDAVSAADGLKRGEQQILNLSMCTPELREKIKDFMCGVYYIAEGSWEELGENVFLLAPASAHVDVAPASPRMSAERN